MEEILKGISDKLASMEERNIRMEKKIDDFKSELIECKQENVKLKNEIRSLKQHTQEQERRMEEMEREVKKRNIIIHGVTEQENESELLRNEKIRIILRDMGIPTEMEAEVNETRRIGKYQEGKTRPIVLETRKWSKKVEILKETKNLRGTNIYMDEDYSRDIQKQRKELLKYMKEFRAEGHTAVVRYNKIIINGDTYSLEQIKTIREQEENKKKGRTVSQRSPGDNPQEELRDKLMKITNTGNTPKN